LSVNPIFHARAKHVAIDFQFVRELVASKDLEILFVPSANQIADVLTKPLVSRRFHHLSYKLNVRSLPLNLREDNTHNILLDLFKLIRVLVSVLRRNSVDHNY
jgi:hypothetical protein